jgi:hypothetical protein
VVSMRLLMSIIKDRHGTFYARKKVPPKLEAAVAQIMGENKPRVSWLKRSLGTKDICPLENITAARSAKRYLLRQ